MVEHLPAINHVESCGRKRQRLAPGLNDLDRDARITHKGSYGASADKVARIGFERGHNPAVAAEHVGGDAPARTNVERPASRIGRKIRAHRAPFRAVPIASGRFSQGIVVETGARQVL